MKRNTVVASALTALVMGCSVYAGDNTPSYSRPYGETPAPRAVSEVASQTVRRDEKDIFANDTRVPWYKGGVWRNRKNKGDNDKPSTAPRGRTYDDYDDDYDDDPVAARRTTNAGSASGGRQAPNLMSDGPGLWDDDYDDDYTGYNPDGSFGRQGGNQAARPSGGSPMGSDPFGGTGGGFNGPDIYANDPSGLAGPVMSAGATAGNYCPPETYPDPYRTGTMSPYGPFDTSNYGGSDTYHPTPPTSNTDYGTAAFVNGQPYAGYGDPYGVPAQTYSQPTYSQPDYNPQTGYPPAGYDSYTGGGFAGDPYSQPAGGYGQPAPYSDYNSYTSAPQNSVYQPAVSTTGSPQFENAVRMVKENRFSEAKAILTAETSRNPGNTAAWRWLADCHYNLLELDDAIICYTQALERDPNDYFALRGQGFSYLHRGHEYWRRMQEEVGKGQKDDAASTFALAHDDYKKALEMLGLCLRRNPGDGEAVFGEAMAAEGASRKLYSNALSYLKLGPGQRERAELFAENCITVIDKGIERSMERARMNPGDAGPRALMGGLYLRKATLYHQLDKRDLALMELRRARDVQQSIIDEIDKNNPTARRSIQECESLWNQWGGNRN